MRIERVDELMRDLVPIVKPSKTHSRYSGASDVSLLTMHVPYPFPYSIVQQALLLLDAKETLLLVLKDKRVGALHVMPSTSADSESDAEDHDARSDKEPPKTEIDLAYFRQDKSLRACIESLYKLFDGIRVFADRRSTTDEYAALIVDGAPVLNPELFSQLLSSLAHFVHDIVIVGQRRFSLKCRFTRASRKRKRI